MNSSAFMDKQIMGLSGSGINIGGVSGGGASGGELFGLMGSQEERRDNGGTPKRDEIVPSYDFHPIRPVPSSPNSSGGAASRISQLSFPFGETTRGPDTNFSIHSGASVDDVDCTVKKYTDILLHALEGMSSRLSQLESRTCILENSVDDLKVSIGNNYGSTDGKLRHLENILNEVQASVQVLRDKQEIAEAHLELSKLQLSTKMDRNQSESLQPPFQSPQLQQYQPPQAHPPPPQHQPMHQAPQLPPIIPSLPSPVPAPNAPPPPPPPLAQQNPPPTPYIPQLALQPQMPSIPSLPLEPSYSKPSHQIQQYAAPPGHPNEPMQYQIPQSQHGLPPQYQPIQPEDPNPYIPPPYPQNIRQPSPPSQPPAGPQQYYGANPSMYELSSAGRPSSGNPPISSSYGGPGFSEPYLYGNSPSHYSTKPSPFSSTPPTSGGSGNYQRLPTAKILPQAAPAGSSSSGGAPAGNRVPVDDVVDKVSTMGFSREQVRATVRKLTENGQSVDLNVVLDRLMNGADAHQPAKGWFGR